MESVDVKGKKVVANALPIVQSIILILCCIIGFSVRCFSPIMWESLIHEFDPHFNYRSTKKLAEMGFYEWWNWFDMASWYPLGRVVGQSLYPGLMLTAFSFYKTLHFFGLVFDIRDVCVFLAPVFSGLTALSTFLLTRECYDDTVAASFAALFVSLSPAYLSRSVAGSFDNEAVAITALVSVFYFYVRAINRKSIAAAVLACFAYLYMVASWGGYVFVTNTIAIYTLAIIILKRFTLSHYAVYSIFHVIGTLMCLNLPIVNFQAITSAEHLTSHGVFFLIQIMVIIQAMQRFFPLKAVQKYSIMSLKCLGVLFVVLFLGLTLTGTTRWAGRSMSLLDPTYASRYIPIIASVSEHQSTTWSSFIFDLHICTIFAPVGLWLVFTKYPKGLFVGIYGLLSAYFSAVMIRLILVMSPAACILGGIGMSYTISNFLFPIVKYIQLCYSKSNKDRFALLKAHGHSIFIGLFITILILGQAMEYVKHGVLASNVAYSNPSVVIGQRVKGGTRVIFDDFREAYQWMGQNTHPNSRVMSWWDYGYQSASMSNRTVIVDNNTWNTTHIATVGLMMSSPEEKAWEIARSLDADYVFIIFGGSVGYFGDDLNKMYWMLKIAADAYPEVMDLVKNFRDGDRGKSMENTLLSKLSYYNFYKTQTRGYDSVRQKQAPKVSKLTYFKEAFSSQYLLVRVYEVLRPDPLTLSPLATSIV